MSKPHLCYHPQLTNREQSKQTGNLRDPSPLHHLSAQPVLFCREETGCHFKHKAIWNTECWHVSAHGIVSIIIFCGFCFFGTHSWPVTAPEICSWGLLVVFWSITSHDLTAMTSPFSFMAILCDYHHLLTASFQLLTDHPFFLTVQTYSDDDRSFESLLILVQYGRR